MTTKRDFQYKRTRLATLAAMVLLAATSDVTLASTITISAPTTMAQTSLSSSDNLDFAASAGKSADLTVTGSQTATSVGPVNMTTAGGLALDNTAYGYAMDLNIAGNGTGNGTGTLSVTGSTPAVNVDLAGVNSLVGSLDIDSTATGSTSTGLLVGAQSNGGLGLTNAPGTAETLNTLAMTGNTTDIDINAGSTLTANHLIFDALNPSGGVDINLTNTNTTGDTLQNNRLSAGSIAFAGGITDTGDTLTLNDGQAGTGTFIAGTLDAYGLTLEAEPVQAGTDAVFNLGPVNIGAGDMQAQFYSGESAAGSITINFTPSAAANDFVSPYIDVNGGVPGQTATLNLDGNTANGPVAVTTNDLILTGAALNANGLVSVSGGLELTGAQMNVNGTATVGGDAMFGSGYSTPFDLAIGNNDSLAVAGNLSLSGEAPYGAPVSYAAASVGKGAAFSVGGNLLASYASFSMNMTPARLWGIATGGYASVSNSRFLINATTGTYKNGGMYPLILTANSAKNSFTGNSFYYVYANSNSSTIDGLTPHIQSGAKGLDLCLGGACTGAAPTPAPAPANTPAPAPASAPAPVVILPVHVVTPAQEAANQPVVAESETLNIAQAKDVSGDLLSTGVTGGGPRGLWGKALGGVSQAGSFGNGYNYGLLTGYGFSVGPQRRNVLGGAFSYMRNVFGTGPADNVSSGDYGLWMYGTLFSPHAYWKVTGALGGGWSGNQMIATSLGFPLTANYGGTWFTAAARASYWKRYGNWVVSPRLSLTWSSSRSSAYDTAGGAFMNVRVGAEDSGDFSVAPAVLVGRRVRWHGETLFPQIRAGLVEDVGPRPADMVTSGASSAVAMGVSLAHTQGSLEARLDIGGTSDTIKPHALTGNLAVKQLFGGGQSSTEAMATLKYYW
ncbi:autotransporter outer membrane beta-barrel domain-containing protein [Acidithiobacillus ferrooxidans]|uniref:autotransporter outer membrane beta-barrel domain-containing protein n=1 Tax=Acidithiobacillus ferrooxidans TaxID=920 RepID=UPI001C07685A|nr:autotransporter outer membrane beta-barrel domain-containing protein [Acidithiobacillus ferrooxidans]MBU2862021.1 autotransporter outer membrane beta-barrel domain-containing protein [Acidithiobacillus ferrooxidans]